MAKQLRKQQEEFCKNFVQSGDAFEAAIKAGYKETTARVQTKKWLETPKFIDYIEKLRKKERYSLDAYIQELDKAMELAYKVKNPAILIKVIEAKGKAFGFDKLSIPDLEEESQNCSTEDLFDKIQEKANVFKKFEQNDTDGNLSGDGS